MSFHLSVVPIRNNGALDTIIRVLVVGIKRRVWKAGKDKVSCSYLNESWYDSQEISISVHSDKL